MAETEKSGGYYRTEVIAQLFGVSVRRVQQLTQEGIIATVSSPEGRRYDLAPTIQRYVRYLSDKAYGKSRSETEAKLKEQKLRAEVALKESQGELHKLRTAIAAGEYVSVKAVKDDYTRFFVVFRKFALNIPNRLAGRLVGFVAPEEVRRVEKGLQEDIRRLLKDFVTSAVVVDGGNENMNG